MEEAKAKGAIAFFGEKYGDRVRVVTVGPSLSVELCGGTHLEHSATIGGFRVTSESSIGSGIRRIEAVTGPKVIELARAQEDLLNEVSKLLKSPRQDVPKKVHKLLEEVSKLKSSGAKAGGSGDAITWDPTPDVVIDTKDGKKILIQAKWAKSASGDELRGASDKIMDREKNAHVFFIGSGTGAFILRTRPAAGGPVDANRIAAVLKKEYQARGGGKPDFVQGTLPDSLARTFDPQSFEAFAAKVMKDVAW
jgi:alanyl-tRNA synthetase